MLIEPLIKSFVASGILLKSLSSFVATDAEIELEIEPETSVIL